MFNPALEDQARGIATVDTGLITAFRCGKEFIVKTGGNYALEFRDKAMDVACDTLEQMTWFRLGMKEELADLHMIMKLAGTY